MSTGGGTMTAQDIARLRELHAKATPGDWWVDDFANKWGVWAIDPVDQIDYTLICDTENDGPDCHKDAAFIAAAHNALPDVLTALEQARAERDAALAELAAVRAQLAEAQASIEYWKDEVGYAAMGEYL